MFAGYWVPGTAERRKSRVPQIKTSRLDAGSFYLAPSNQGATVMVTGIWLSSEPEVPISSMVVVPVGARLVALQTSVTFVLPFAGGVTGLDDAVADTSVGNSFTLNVTAEWNPFTLVTVRVVLTLPLSSMVNDDGDSDSVKFGVPEEAFTVRAIVAL
jgi:hypothetical protein